MIVRLQFKPAKTHRVLNLTFENETEVIAQLAKPRAYITKPEGDYLEFQPSALYLGISVKRKPYSGEEIRSLLPHESVRSEVDLDDFYDIPTGSVRVRYSAWHPTEEVGIPLEVVSDWIDVPPLSEI
jgi:hypothetical protein